MESADNVLAKKALTMVKKNPDMAKKAGKAAGKVAYDNREAIASYANEHKEEIA